MANCIITIGRQCGSGGHTIGKLVAQRLELPFYDKEIVELAASKTKLSPEFIRSHGEYFSGGALGHIIGYGTRFDSNAKTGSALTDHLHNVQSEIILEEAAKGSCVIVGRCADYILRDQPRCLKVFVNAPLDQRIRRAREEYGVQENNLESYVIRQDKARASYYNYFATGRWGQSREYDLCVNSRIGINAAVKVIRAAAQAMLDEE